MHDAIGYAEEKEIVDQKAIELAKDFSYDGYQVVRRELFAHLREPAVVIRRDTENGEASAEEVKRKNRIPFYPKEWKDSFGLPVEEHKKALEINILDGYAEFSTPK